MKNHMLLGALLFASAAFAVDEGSSRSKISEMQESSPGEYQIHLVPQVGMSSMSYSGQDLGKSGQAFSGGLTTEIGQTKARLLETGLIFLGGSSTVSVNGNEQQINTTHIAIPLMAKIRFISTKSQAWYAKLGALTAFETATSDANLTRSFDVLISGGVGARVPITRKADLLLEGTYNRGTFNALRNGYSVFEGIVAFTGVSVEI